MSASLQSFREGLYEEHLEEAGFLHERCRQARHSPGVAWLGAAAIEYRAWLHLDALSVGGLPALDVVVRRAQAGDPGEVHAAALLLCRLRDNERLVDLLHALDPDDDAVLDAVGEALMLAWPTAWTRVIEPALRRPDRRWRVPLARACAHHRLPCGEALLALLHEPGLPERRVVQALGRLRVGAAIPRLRDVLREADDDGLRQEALTALALAGDGETVRAHYVQARRASWPRLLVAIAGDAQAEHALMPADGLPPTADRLLALGLLGLPSALRPLFEALNDPALAPSAALGLNLITGAQLYEQAFVPEAIDEAELFPKEARAWRATGEVPLAANGLPFGEQTTRLSADPYRWHAWLSAHASAFEAGRRYRWGQPCTPEQVAVGLTVRGWDPRIRQAAWLELSLRHGCDLPFDLDLPVAAQQQAIADIQAWAKQVSSGVVAGAWYFGGVRT